MSSSVEKRYRTAAERLAERMRLFKKLRLQARECDREVIELHPDELFDTRDQAVLDEFEAAKAALTGQRLLPMESGNEAYAEGVS